MSEPDTLRGAKEYMDLLSRGVDPVTGREMPQDAVLAQEQLRRCFRYVSGILEGAINRSSRGGSAQRSAQRTARPAPPAEASLTQLLDGARGLGCAPGRLRGLVYRWMMAEGYIENGEGGSRLTQKGREAGFAMAERGDNGARLSDRVTLSPAAQSLVEAACPQVVRKDRDAWQAFIDSMAPERLMGLCQPQEELTITKITTLVNGTLDPEQERKLCFTAVLDWMEEQGYMAREDAGGKQVRRPTDQGLAIGMIAPPSARHGSVTYGEQGQAFVLSHAQEIARWLRGRYYS